MVDTFDTLMVGPTTRKSLWLRHLPIRGTHFEFHSGFVMAGRGAGANLRVSAYKRHASGSTDASTPSRQGIHEAGDLLRQFVLNEYRTRGMSAKLLTTLCWYVTKAGGAGVSDLSVDPDSKGDNHAKHVASALKLRKDRFYFAKVPMWDHHTQSRIMFDLPFFPVHETFF